MEKLIRDRITEKALARGEVMRVRKAESDWEFRAMLTKKLVEEAKECHAARSRRERRKELADVLAVLTELLRLEKVSWEELRVIAEAKRVENGGFAKRLIWLDAPENP